MPPDDTSPPDTPPGVSKGHKWVTISEAVGLTGKSERTIRRYIADGSLSNRRERGRRLVNLADIATIDSDPPSPESSQPSTGQADDCQARVRQLEADVRRLSELLVEVRSERDYLRQLHAMKEAKLIEATTPPARRTWWWPWSKTEA